MTLVKFPRFTSVRSPGVAALEDCATDRETGEAWGSCGSCTGLQLDCALLECVCLLGDIVRNSQLTVLHFLR